MPYQFQEDQDQELLKKDEQQQLLSAAPGVVSTDASLAQQKQDTPTGFTNVDQYLSQNTQQAQDLAGKLGGLVQGDIQKAYGAIEGAQGQYKGDVEAGTQAMGPTTLLNQDIAQQNQEKYLQAQRNTDDFARDQSNVDWFQNMLKAQYQGPESLEAWSGYGDLSKTTGRGIQSGDAYKTDTGRDSLISRMLGNKISGGGMALNKMLLQGTPEAMSSLETQSQHDIQNRLDALSGLAGQYTSEGKDLTSKVAPQLRTTFNPQNVKDDISLRMQAEQNKNKDYMDQLNRQYAGYGMDVSPYTVLQNPNIYNTATHGDYERMQALSNLYGDPTIGQYLPMSQIGQANTVGQRGFDTTRYLRDAHAKQAADFAATQARVTTPPKSQTWTAKKTSPTVICTELHRQGYFNDGILQLDEVFGKHIRLIKPHVYNGYMTWAPTVVKWMQKSRLITKIVAPFGVAWANYMAGKSSLLGKIVLSVGMSICGIIGKCKGVK